MAQCNEAIDTDLCTLDTCCWDQGYLHYPPAVAPTAAYLAIFAVLLFAQLGIGLWYRTWGFVIGMVCSLVLEVVGYIFRFMLRSNPFSLGSFLGYFIPLGLGPAFITASIYLTLARVVVVYGPKFSFLAPRMYTIIFLSIDVSSLIIQAVGGSLSASAETDSDRQKGVDALIAGLTFQAVSLFGFIFMASLFLNNVRRGPKEDRNPEFQELRSRPTFRIFLVAVAASAIFVFIRCVYRVTELCNGFDGKLANDQGLFLALEGPMIMVATVCMTVWHPGIVFQGRWQSAAWHLRAKNDSANEKIASLESDLDP